MAFWVGVKTIMESASTILLDLTKNLNSILGSKIGIDL